MHFNENKACEIIDRAIARLSRVLYTETGKFTGKAYITKEPVPFENKTVGTEITVEEGKKWAELWDCAWMHFEGTLPANGKHNVIMLSIAGEACVFDETGNPVKGLTNVSSGFDFSLGTPGKFIVEPDILNIKDGKFSFWVDCGMNDLFGSYSNDGKIEYMRTAIQNDNAVCLSFDMRVLFLLYKELHNDDPRKYSILHALYEAANELGNGINDESIKKAEKILEPELKKKNGDASLSLSAIGHAHIDLAWLWPIRETKRKGARTFSTAIDLMNRYPDYVFGASQPQLYKWVKDMYPGLYAKIKQRVAEGRWEPQGAMWVEADTNVSSGEALVRQVLYGKRFYQKEFGKDIKTLWLPDVFGYSSALPQILKKAGVDNFMTIKLSWSEHNKFPHHTFIWKGIDGSSVLAHMPPEGTYNSGATPKSISDAQRNYAEKGVCPEALLLFGIGDGGGGPGAEHLENLKREKNLAGLAPVKQGLSEDFFKRIEKYKNRFPEWSGELYLEKHQGTYTTQSRNKYYNRKCEFALAELEFASVLAKDCGVEYPKKELDEFWEEILLYQFHDILPGSSIPRVYNESVERYREILTKVKDMTAAAYEKYAKSVGFKGTVYFNPTGFERTENVLENGEWKKVTVYPFGASTAKNAKFKVKAAKNKLENENLRVIFNEKGQVTSIFDKQNNREALSAPCNVFNLYNDESDAWDMKFNYRDDLCMNPEAESCEVSVDGGEAVAKFTYKFGNSTIIQSIVLGDGEERVDFRTYVDWHEKFKMLRVNFPFDVMTNEAVCNVQFGEFKRPTHKNTSWDYARFEMCAQKYVDFRETGYGVALLNDSKYGMHVEGSSAELNLLRSAGYPGGNADEGEHCFTYSVFPHASNEDVVCEAYRLNEPLTAVHISDEEPEERYESFGMLAGNAVVETIKRAEDSDEIIIRAYEPIGARAELIIKPFKEIKEAYDCDLLENNGKKYNVSTNSIFVDFKPFEIKTIKIKL